MSMYNHPSLNAPKDGDEPIIGSYKPTDDKSDCVNMEEDEPLSKKWTKIMEAFYQRFGEYWTDTELENVVGVFYD